MAGTWRLGTASMVLATVWTMAGRVAEAQLAPLPLRVAVYDYAALPPPVLERAKGVATTIYGRIGVSVKWLEDSQVAAELPTNTAACPDSPTPLIHLRLLGRSPNQRRPTGDLGFAVSGGTLASVLVERLKHVATSKSQDVGDLLGVIMAHEIGHLLLPPDSHATGIMAPKVDLFLIEHGGLSFEHRQASLIRARIGSMPRSEQGPCWASGTFGLSQDPHDIAASDQAAFIRLLDEAAPGAGHARSKDDRAQVSSAGGRGHDLNASAKSKVTRCTQCFGSLSVPECRKSLVTAWITGPSRKDIPAHGPSASSLGGSRSHNLR